MLIHADIFRIIQEIEAFKAQYANAKEKLLSLKQAESNIKKQRESAMKELESSVKSSQKTLTAVKAELVTLKNKRDALTTEIKALAKDAVSLTEQLTICEKSLARLSGEADAIVSEVICYFLLSHCVLSAYVCLIFLQQLHLVKTAYDEASKAVAAKTQEISSCNKEIKALEKEKDKLLKESQTASLEARKLSHKLKQWEKDFKDASKAITSLIKQHPWIEKEKSFFGQPGSDFDFKARNAAQCAKRLKELKADQERLSKKINKKVMGMIENAETEYDELTRKRQVRLLVSTTSYVCIVSTSTFTC
jgi:structural maintenance of chromosome 2